ncbi:MAG: amidophosphoribosyltransferase [Candidatus Norongarragalinales archaeon]
MCGIIGVIRFDGGRAAFDAYTGLLSLQHRGQDSAGIASFDGVRIHLKKGVGLVQNVFTPQNLVPLKGSVAIGQVRYATIGSNPKLDAQPFTVGVPNALAMAHNGNVVNYGELYKKYKERIEGHCDVEVILQVFADALAKNECLYGNPLSHDRVFDAVAEVMRRVNGSYVVVTILEGEGLLAFRDPLAIKPMVMGFKKNAAGEVVARAFASESVAFDALDFELERDVRPGEAVIVTPKGRVVTKTIKAAPKPAHCMFEYVYFARPDSVLDGKSVYEARLALGRELGAACKRQGNASAESGCCAVDVVLPVPDTSRAAAQTLAEEIGVKSREGLIKNRYVARTFIMPSQEKRESAVRVNLNVIDSVVAGKRVALVDDSIVRGTTSRKIIELVKKKAKTVHFFVTCPPIVSPCFYGIDFPTKSELIAAGKTVEEIRRELGCDALTYQTLEGLQRAVGVPGLCVACLTGEYPTKIEAKDMNEFARMRERERRQKLRGISKEDIYLD